MTVTSPLLSTLFVARNLRSIFFVLAIFFSFSHAYYITPNPEPTDFVNTYVAGNFWLPTNFDFPPDGSGRIFVAEKHGYIKVIEPNGNIYSWLEIPEKVTGIGDHGILDIEFHPNFVQNGWVYILYTQEPENVTESQNPNEVTQGRLVRYTEVNGVASPQSEYIIIGDRWGNGFPSCSSTHNVGSVVFGLDGTLFVNGGDGAHFENVDDGNNNLFPQYDVFCEAVFGTENDVGVLRSQLFTTIAGKILRIDPDNGRGIGLENYPNLVPNPFYENGLPFSVRSRVWTMGHRNSFRVSVRPDSTVPGPGVLYASEVGWNFWEEYNVARNGGENFGWPCFGGPLREPLYNSIAESALLYNWCQTNAPNMPYESSHPFIAYHHVSPTPDNGQGGQFDIGFIGNAASGAAFYMGGNYPYQFQGNSSFRAVFFADFGQQRIDVTWVDENDQMITAFGIQNFFGGLGSVVAIHTEPVSGDLYYLSHNPPELHRFVYIGNGGGPPVIILPVVNVVANVTAGSPPPLTVEFNTDGTYDPRSNPLTFAWNFGDGGVSSDRYPIHTYTTSGQFNATLTVTAEDGRTASKTILIRTDNDPPHVRIVSPTDLSEFTSTQVVQFQSVATDRESPLSGLTFRWELRIIHNNHDHPDSVVSSQQNFSASPGPFISAIEREMFYVFLVVTDEQGLKTTDMVRIRLAGTTNQPPVSSFEVAPVEGLAPLTIQVTSTSTDPDLDQVQYLWDWGDGITNTGRVLRHTYTAPGTYVISHRVIDTFGLTSTSYKTIRATEPRSDGLIAYYPLDDIDPAVIDCSGNANHGVNEGATVDMDAAYGTAVSFQPGTRISIPTSPTLSTIAGALTISAWIKLNAIVNNPMRIVSKKEAWNGGSGFELEYNPVTGILRLLTAGPEVCDGTVFATANQWTHVSAVIENNQCRFYMDGVDVTSVNDAIGAAITGNALLLSIGATSTAADATFGGSIDEVFIFNAALTQAQIQNLVNGNPPQPVQCPGVFTTFFPTSSPGTSAPGTSATSAPGTSAPGTSATETSAPGTSEPGTSMPVSESEGSTAVVSDPASSTPVGSSVLGSEETSEEESSAEPTEEEDEAESGSSSLLPFLFLSIAFLLF